MIDDLLPFAKDAYQNINTALETERMGILYTKIEIGP